MIDDIDGSEAAETVHFALDDREYEIDLNEDHANRLREALAPYMGHARRPERRVRKSQTSGAADPASIRVWAAQQGIEVASRGRIPAGVVEKYQAAHS